MEAAQVLMKHNVDLSKVTSKTIHDPNNKDEHVSHDLDQTENVNDSSTSSNKSESE